MSTTLMAAPAASPLTDEHKRQFDEKGFFVLERVIPDEHLDLLRDGSARLIAQIDAQPEGENPV